MYRKLGKTASQRKALLRNQATALLANGKIITTEARAKEVRKIVEPLIALAIKEKDNFETVKVTAKVARKDKDGKRVKEEDLEVTTMRSSGAGGQHINKTDSAVRMTHKPTGITAFSQSERSQILNRERCLSVIKAKLYQKAIEDQENEKRKLKGEQKI